MHYKIRILRRPLAAASLLFVAVLWLVVTIWPPPTPEPDCEDGVSAEYEGVVTDIECYTDSDTDEEIRLVYLKQASLSPDGSQADQSQISSASTYRIICYIQDTDELPRIGARVRYRGRVDYFNEATNPGEFDARTYYQARGYAFRLKNATLIATGESYFRLGQLLYELKTLLSDALKLALSAREASVARAMLLGERRGLDSEWKELYQMAGIFHILAISGLHITMIGNGIRRVLGRFLGKRWSAAVSVLFLLVYLFMIGFSVSALRALLLFAMSMAAELMGRTSDSATSLALAAVLLLIENPAYLTDSGFLLSFCAAGGAAVLIPAYESMRKRHAGTYEGWREEAMSGRFLEGARRAFRASFCISLATLPVLLDAYYEWNPLSILINVIVLPLMGVLLCCVILLSVTGGVLLSIGSVPLAVFKGYQLLALPVRGILWLYEKLCRIGTYFPISLFRSGQPQGWQILVFYGGLLLIVLFATRLKEWKGMAAGAVLCLVFLVRPAGMQMTMLDVGQGDCIYIRSEDGREYLCDGGSTSKSDTGTWQIIPFLKYQGTTRLELIFVTHWDADHYNGILEVLEWAAAGRLEVGGLVLGAAGEEDENYLSLLMAAEEAEVPVYRMGAGDELTLGSASFLALSPGAGETYDDRNAASLVLLYTENSFKALLTGDVEEEGEEWMLDEWGDILSDITVLKVAHHGSRTSTGESLLAATRPQLALISCGVDNSYGHPHEEVLNRLKEYDVLTRVTAECGAITLRKEGDGLVLETYLDSPVS